MVFNDFMNCLMGDPTAERLAPLIEAAASAGAEYFCIDAGWYDDEAGPPGPGGVPSWWDAVGDWQPAPSRFPDGLDATLKRIRAAGMVPGLWLEPEVIGVRGAAAARLPDEAFLRRAGARVVEWGRHQLDLSHPAARAHLDETVDRLVGEWGVGYLKLDYNIDIGPCDRLLEHNRAYLAWLDGLRDRYPDLVVEGCAAGGMRLDGATLSRVALQSLTDQQDDLLVPAIAAAAPTVVPPEQGAVWAYPHGDRQRIAFGMVSAMLGRVHLSGRLDLLDPDGRALVAEAVAVYKRYRSDLARGVPHWPLGLPTWDAERVALALDCGDAWYLAVWRRGGPDGPIEIGLPVSGTVTRLFPDEGPATLTVDLPAPYGAALLRIVPG